FLVLTADGKGVPLVKPEALRLAAFEEKTVRPGNRRMATVCSVYSVDAFHRTAADVVAGLFRDPTDTQSSPTCRPAPQHKRLPVIARSKPARHVRVKTGHRRGWLC
ncbi:MAG: hypothetical protein ACK5YO_04715, partial [Planctomyces sp.]